MEKFNEADLMKEIKSCTYDQDYETAVKLAEKLDLNRMKNVSSLCLLGDIFLHEGEKDLAEKVLLKAYEKMPKGRRALDLLTSLYIEKESYSEAEYYYKEFISVASRDLHRYILRYRLDKGKGERTSVLIHTLEQLKDYEYIEEWAYELAKLYFEAGENKKCIRECDEIALWFGQGEYVDMANALKAEVNAKMEADAAAVLQQKTVGATYMFDSEGLLERSDFNVPLNVDEYMQDDEYSDVYDLEEGGKTETIAVEPAAIADEISEAEEETEEPEPAVADEVIEEVFVSDSDIIAAKASSILTSVETMEEVSDEVEEEPLVEDVEPEAAEDFVARIQKNIEVSRTTVRPSAEENLESRMRMMAQESVTEDDDEEDEDIEVIDDKADQITMDLFFGEMGLTTEPVTGLSEVPDDEDEDADEMIRVVEEPISTGILEDEDEIVTDDIPIPDTVLDIFSTAVDIRDVKKQLAETFTKLESSLLEKEDILAPYDINFVVSGTDESMKSQISIGIAKALNTYGICDKTKIVRATADELNSMDFSLVFEKIAGGCLIIGGAGTLSDKSVEIISDYVNRDEQKVAIVLEDSETDLLEIWKKYPKLRAKFLNVINISKYDVSELEKLAESYAKRRGYDISDEVRKVTLKDIFEQRMTSGQDVNYEDVMAVIDEAVVNLEKRNVKNLFMTVLDNAYKEASMFTLLPEDFD